MDDFKQLGESIYRERVLRARRTDPEEKMRDGPRLFDYACWITMSGIRNQNPGVSEERVLELLKERIALQKRLEKHK